MGEIFKWVVIIIVVFALLGFFLSKDGQREDGAKAGAYLGGSLIISILPTVLVIFFIILIVRACA